MRICRHRDSWWICGGNTEWCYRCGSLRRLESEAGSNKVFVASPWCSPVGIDGDNPFGAWDKRCASYLKARETRRKNRNASV